MNSSLAKMPGAFRKDEIHKCLEQLIGLTRSGSPLLSESKLEERLLELRDTCIRVLEGINHPDSSIQKLSDPDKQAIREVFVDLDAVLDEIIGATFIEPMYEHEIIVQKHQLGRLATSISKFSSALFEWQHWVKNGYQKGYRDRIVSMHTHLNNSRSISTTIQELVGLMKSALG